GPTAHLNFLLRKDKIVTAIECTNEFEFTVNSTFLKKITLNKVIKDSNQTFDVGNCKYITDFITLNLYVQALFYEHTRSWKPDNEYIIESGTQFVYKYLCKFSPEKSRIK
ncbi:hypothetical protein RFI_02862, partial [Reticulomyxa filosa]